MVTGDNALSPVTISNSFGVPLGFLWDSFGIPLVFLWYSFGIASIASMGESGCQRGRV